MSKTAVIICPGRGTYNKTELGVLRRDHPEAGALLADFDARRAALGQETLTALDSAARFSPDLHTRGDNASALIYAATVLDAQKIHPSYEIVGVTGNSMGWYSALALGGAATPMAGFEIVNTMGGLMQAAMIGGQSLYPFVDDDWREIPGRRQDLLELVAEVDARADHTLAVSILLGGMLVVAGDDAGLQAFEMALPPVQGRFPMRLPNHAAFHTPLQSSVAAQGRAALPESLFEMPRVPMIDGQGRVWYPKSCSPSDLRDYTLGPQVVSPYDFSAAIRVAARNFAPDVFIITGPGTTLGGAVAQALIGINWRGLDSKADFQTRQKTDPLVLSMGRAEDRRLVLSGLS